MHMLPQKAIQLQPADANNGGKRCNHERYIKTQTVERRSRLFAFHGSGDATDTTMKNQA